MRQYQQVTDRIIAMLESGVRPWAQDWSAPGGGGRPLRHNGIPYRGVNVLNLWSAAMARGFTSAHWMSYKTAADLGGQVKKGAKSEPVFYVGAVTRQVERDGDLQDRTIAFLKCYPAFNADEIENLPAMYRGHADTPRLNSGERSERVDAWIADTGAVIGHGGGRCYFRPSTDAIQMAEFSAFSTPEGYYSTLMHELTHWTGAEKRLDRGKGRVFGSPDYAFEELIAELGAAYLCADLHIGAEVREDHASYIKSWLKALRDDARNIFRAASHAERACGYLHKASSPASATDAADMAQAA
jgi:antirestriction protein ArdC